MQRIQDYGLLGISKPQTAPPNADTAPGAKPAHGGSEAPLTALPARRLSLADATQAAAPSDCATTLPLSGRTPGRGRDAAPPIVGPPTASGVRAKRDDENAVIISEKQAEGYLPDGRYRVQDPHGRTLRTIEIGQSWCAEGLRLVRTRKGTEAAAKRLVKEKALQDDLFGELR